ncbi:MAG: hypothetical protein ACRBBU_06455 [Pseudooceanicola sp.]
MTQFLKLAHLTRGSRFARGVNSRTIELLGSDPVPIVPDREDGVLDWQAADGPTYLETAKADEGWWMNAAQEGWRAALVEGAIVWVRQVMPNGIDDPGVGRSKGVWRVAMAEITPNRLFLTLSDRIGDVK